MAVRVPRRLWVRLLLAVLCAVVRCRACNGTDATPGAVAGLLEQFVAVRLQPTISRLNDLVGTVDSRLSSLDSRLSSLDSRLSSLDSRLTPAPDSAEDPPSSRAEESVSRLTARLDGLGVLLAAQQSRLDALAAQLAGRRSEPARDCSDLPASTPSGVHLLHPGLDSSLPPVPAFCDMETDGGGWTVIQRRADISPRQEFYLGWAAYREGFGELHAEFWWGLEHLWRTTGPRDRRYQLLVQLADFDGERRTAGYQQFRVASEADGYRLSVANYSGDAGDSFSYHNGKKFTTKDRDHDDRSDNCAVTFEGAGWYASCYRNNINGQYLSGVKWNAWRGDRYSLKEVELKIRPIRAT